MTREDIRKRFIQRIASDYAADEEDPFLALSPEEQEKVCPAKEFEFDSLEKLFFLQMTEKEFGVKIPPKEAEIFIDLSIGQQIDAIMARIPV